MARVADVIAETLKAYGTEYFFQVTGGDASLWIALEKAGIRMIPCRSEQGATYMADGYARVSGRPGFVYGQHGPGAANIASAMADAYWAGSPVISLTSSIAFHSRNRYDYQELDQLTMYAPVTRWAKEVLRPGDTALMLRNAIRAATGSPPGPVHLDVPRDMFSVDTPAMPVHKEPAFGAVPSTRTAPPREAVKAVVDELLAARRPVLIAGAGVLLSQAWPEVERLAEALSLPVATSLGGKGSIREDHDLAIGVIGRYSRKVANEIVCECDVALVVGSRLGGLATNTFSVPSGSARILHVDVDSGVLGTTYPEAVSVQADAKLALEAILEEVQVRADRPAEATEWSRQVRERVRQWWDEVRRIPGTSPTGMHPAAVIAAIGAALAPTDILVADTGYMTAWTGVLHTVQAPGRHFVRATGSLGWAVAGSMGAALAARPRAVVCVTGDGGAGYNIAEVETAVRCGIPVVVVVLNNRSLAFEYHIQKVVERHVVAVANDFTDVDFGTVARAFGARGARITDLAKVTDAVRDAVKLGAVTVLDVPVDKEAMAPVTNYERLIPRTV